MAPFYIFSHCSLRFIGRFGHIILRWMVPGPENNEVRVSRALTTGPHSQGRFLTVYGNVI